VVPSLLHILHNDINVRENNLILITFGKCISLWEVPSHFAHKVPHVSRYQRGNQNPYIEEEQTTQWPKEKGQKDKQ
jgi:hypothetical protein